MAWNASVFKTCFLKIKWFTPKYLPISSGGLINEMRRRKRQEVNSRKEQEAAARQTFYRWGLKDWVTTGMGCAAMMTDPGGPGSWLLQGVLILAITHRMILFFQTVLLSTSQR